MASLQEADVRRLGEGPDVGAMLAPAPAPTGPSPPDAISRAIDASMWTSSFSALLLAGTAIAPPPDLTALPKPLTVAGAAVKAAYDNTEAAQRGQPAPTSDRERLLRLQELDQAGRQVLVKVDLSHLSPSDRTAAMNEMGEQIARQDQIDQKELKRLLPPSGWFSISMSGTDGAQAAWLIVQHATDDPELMRTTVRKLDELRRTGEAKPTAYAIMYDQVALMFDHKGQRYGTQLECRAVHQRPQRIDDPVHVDSRRRSVGFQQTEAAYLASMDDGYCRRIP